MKLETMFYIAIGNSLDFIEKANAYAEYASTEDHKPFLNKYNRLALKNKTMAVVEFDRCMDRLVKESK